MRPAGGVMGINPMAAGLWVLDLLYWHCGCHGGSAETLALRALPRCLDLDIAADLYGAAQMMSCCWLSVF